MPQRTTPQFYDINPLIPAIGEGVVLLTPNVRLARRIRSEWNRHQSERGLRSWRPVAVYALESWLKSRWLQARQTGSVPSKVLLEGSAARELWLDVIEQAQADSASYSLLQPAAAAEAAEQARDTLLRWCIDAGHTSTRDAFQSDYDCGVFYRWLEKFESRLNAGSLATLSDGLTDLLHASICEQQAAVMLVECDDICPLHRNLLARLASQITEFNSSGREVVPEVIEFSERRQELRTVARRAAELHASEPESTVGIVLADSHGDSTALAYELRLAFDCMGENYNSLPVNFSTGISLDRAPVVRDALRILECTAPTIPLSVVTGLLQSRFTTLGDYSADHAVDLIQRLHNDGRQQVDTAHLRSLAAGKGDVETKLGLGEALYQVFELRLHRLKLAPSDWVEHLCQILDCWGWPGHGPLDSVEYQQVERWYETLDQFAALDSIHRRLGLQQALQVLRRCCQGVVSHPQTADSRIQVLGMLETAGQQFQHLWLVGLEAGRWPAPVRPNPFIPVRIQTASGMPHASREREWQFAVQLLSRYRRSASTVTVSYCSELDGIPATPSPLLSEFPPAEVVSPEPLHGDPLPAGDRLPLEWVPDQDAPGVRDDECAGLRGGSAILEDQANCPFRAFARRRLNLVPLGDYLTALSPGERGSILHDALFSLWDELGDSEKLLALENEGEVIDSAVDLAIDAIPVRIRHRVGRTCIALERRRLEGLLSEWLALEKQRAPFVVLAREQTIDTRVGGIPLRLRADRIDELESGQRLLIDYKSGKNSLADWLGERPVKPQLPIYGISGERVDGLAFAEVRARECRFLGLGEIEGTAGIRSDIVKAVGRYSDAGDWQELRSQWHHNLEQLASEFLAGSAAVQPAPRACDYCGLESLCRVEIPQEGVGE